MDGGHDGNTEIDQAALIAHAETAVLRDAALGDVELAHHLDARNDGGVPVLGDGRHGVMQHAVNAVLDGHFLIARLDVDVAGAPLERVEDGGVDKLDHRRDGAIGGELVDGESLVLILLIAGHYIQRETFGDLFQHALRLFGFLEQVGNLRKGGDLDLELFLQQHGKLVDQVEIARVGERDVQMAVRPSESARSCSGTSGRRGRSGTDRDRCGLLSGRRTRSDTWTRGPLRARFLPPGSRAWCDR